MSSAKSEVILCIVILFAEAYIGRTTHLLNLAVPLNGSRAMADSASDLLIRSSSDLNKIYTMTKFLLLVRWASPSKAALKFRHFHSLLLRLCLIAGSEICVSAADPPSASSVFQARAIQKFPEIGIAGSEANRRFLTAVEEAKNMRPNIFKYEDWPLQIALENESVKSLSTALLSNNSKLIVDEALGFKNFDKDIERKVNQIGVELRKVCLEYEKIQKSWHSISKSVDLLLKNAQTNENYVSLINPSDTSSKVKADQQRIQAELLVQRFKDSTEVLKTEERTIIDSLKRIGDDLLNSSLENKIFAFTYNPDDSRLRSVKEIQAGRTFAASDIGQAQMALLYVSKQQSAKLYEKIKILIMRGEVVEETLTRGGRLDVLAVDLRISRHELVWSIMQNRLVALEGSKDEEISNFTQTEGMRATIFSHLIRGFVVLGVDLEQVYRRTKNMDVVRQLALEKSVVSASLKEGLTVYGQIFFDVLQRKVDSSSMAHKSSNSSQ